MLIKKRSIDDFILVTERYYGNYRSLNYYVYFTSTDIFNKLMNDEDITININGFIGSLENHSLQQRKFENLNFLEKRFIRYYLDKFEKVNSEYIYRVGMYISGDYSNKPCPPDAFYYNIKDNTYHELHDVKFDF